MKLCKRALEIVEVKARKTASSCLPLNIPQVQTEDIWRVVLAAITLLALALLVRTHLCSKRS